VLSGSIPPVTCPKEAPEPVRGRHRGGARRDGHALLPWSQVGPFVVSRAVERARPVLGHLVGRTAGVLGQSSDGGARGFLGPRGEPLPLHVAIICARHGVMVWLLGLHRASRPRRLQPAPRRSHSTEARRTTKHEQGVGKRLVLPAWVG
jgi:hypothetical protein